MRGVAIKFLSAICALSLGLYACSGSPSAAEPDAKAWLVEASSKDGKFSVSFPCKANEGKVDGDAQGGIIVGHSLGCVSGDGTKFIAVRSVYKEGRKGADHYFGVMKQGMWQNGKTVVAADGNSVDAHIREGMNCAWSRVERAQDDLVVLIVEANGVDCLNAQNDRASSFFNSLKAS